MSSWFKANFPESLYPCNNQNYKKRIESGYEIAKKSTVIICGLARDLGEVLEYTQARVERLRSFFSSSTLIIVENDSIDGTDKVIQNWADIPVCLTLSNTRHQQNKLLSRRIDMAFYRNLYLEKFKDLESDYVIVLDTDLWGGWSYEGILNSLSYNYDVIGSNSLLYQNNKRLYFDSWAFRHEATENPNLMLLSRGREPFEVDSCFGGLALYKRECFNNVTYDQTDCDHVTIHKKMQNNGFKIWINPSQITLYNKHNYVI